MAKTDYEKKIRDAVARLPPLRAPEVLSELILSLLEALPPKLTEQTYELLSAAVTVEIGNLATSDPAMEALANQALGGDGQALNTLIHAALHTVPMLWARRVAQEWGLPLWAMLIPDAASLISSRSMPRLVSHVEAFLKKEAAG